MPSEPIPDPILTKPGAAPLRQCQLCPRLHAFREDWATREPDWWNAPVPSFGDPDAQLLIVGLAPGLRGANRTARPFTGDYAGDLLYATLEKFGLANNAYAADPEDGLALTNTLVTNAVRCVPPQNKPIGAEIKTCRPFLVATIAALPHLRAILALGRVAHESTLTALGVRRASAPFGHNARHLLGGLARSSLAPNNLAPNNLAPDNPMPSDLILGDLVLFDSYHCSRYNTNTGRLTTEMFEDVFRSIQTELKR